VLQTRQKIIINIVKSPLTEQYNKTINTQRMCALIDVINSNSLISSGQSRALNAKPLFSLEFSFKRLLPKLEINTHQDLKQGQSTQKGHLMYLIILP